MSYKTGDLIRIIKNTTSHGKYDIYIGQICEIKTKNGNMYRCEMKDGQMLWCRKEEIQLHDLQREQMIEIEQAL